MIGAQDKVSSDWWATKTSQISRFLARFLREICYTHFYTMAEGPYSIKLGGPWQSMTGQQITYASLGTPYNVKGSKWTHH